MFRTSIRLPVALALTALSSAVLAAEGARVLAQSSNPTPPDRPGLRVTDRAQDALRPKTLPGGATVSLNPQPFPPSPRPFATPVQSAAGAVPSLAMPSPKWHSAADPKGAPQSSLGR
jgi:hypothetical protein